MSHTLLANKKSNNKNDPRNIERVVPSKYYLCYFHRRYVLPYTKYYLCD